VLGFVVISAAFLVGHHAPFGLASLIALALGVAFGLADAVREARRDNAGDDDYLRRQIKAPPALEWARDRLALVMRKRGDWRSLARGVAVAAVLAFVTWRYGDSVLWWAFFGFFAAELTAYPHWQRHWQRLLNVAEGDKELLAWLGVARADGEGQVRS